MEFFFVTKDISIVDRGYYEEIYQTALRLDLKAPPARRSHTGGVTSRDIYVSLHEHVRDIHELLDRSGHRDLLRIFVGGGKRQIIQHPDFPMDLTHPFGSEPLRTVSDKLLNLAGRSPLKIGLIASGVAFGDTLVLLTALDCLHRRISSAWQRIEYAVFFRLMSRVEPLFDRLPFDVKLHQLPVSLSELMTCDAVIDLDGMVDAPEFHELPMIDYLLKRMSVPPGSVPAELKRIRFPIASPDAPGQGLILPPANGRHRVFLNPLAATPVRCVPARHIPSILTAMHDLGWTVHTIGNANSDSPPIFDLSGKMPAFTDYVSVLAQMDVIVTVDSAALYVADLLNLPALAMFATVPPQLRIPYYPTVKGLLLGPADHRLRRVHESHDPADIQEIESLWDKYLPQVLDSIAHLALDLPSKIPSQP